ncbi:MAG: hypothetical protein JNJ54_15715 [Myxococcaceae bacterium]|nr:hypothetical protein [Myxococcaceae bacterium]
MRLVVVGLLSCWACAPPPASRNLGDPRGPSRAQDQGQEAPLGLASDVPEAGPGAFSLLAANVGNIDLFRCDTAVFKLCAKDQEDRIAAAIARAKPDVVLLSEVITPAQCDALGPSVEPWHVCHPANRAQEPDQVRRLLGSAYTIACEPRRGYECVAVRTGFATLDGCEQGELCRGQLRSAMPVAGCDEGFTIAGVTATIDGEAVDLVVAHPPSGLMPANIACRRDFLPAALSPMGEGASLRRAPLAVIGGDFNLDPFRRPMDADVQLWRERVRFSVTATGGALLQHSGLPEHDPPWWSAPLTRSTWDHVLSEGFAGRCATLGAQRNYPALDEQKGSDLERLDHLAQYCVLSRAR